MTQYVKDSGTWQPVAFPYVKDSGSWKGVQGGYVKQSGVWRKFHETKNVTRVGYASTSGGSNPILGPFDIGDAIDSREIFVIWHMKPSGTAPSASSTICGVTPTVRFSGSRGSNPDSTYGYMMATVPSGTTGTVNFVTGSNSGVSVAVYRIVNRTNIGAGPTAFLQSGQDTGNYTASLGVLVPSGGFAISLFGSATGTAPTSMTTTAGGTGVTSTFSPHAATLYWGAAATSWTTFASASGTVYHNYATTGNNTLWGGMAALAG